MKFRIEYCGVWNYEPRARRARDLILARQPTADVALVRKGGGLFEVEKDGVIVFSKKAEGRFPEDSEITRFAD